MTCGMCQSTLMETIDKVSVQLTWESTLMQELIGPEKWLVETTCRLLSDVAEKQQHSNKCANKTTRQPSRVAIKAGIEHLKKTTTNVSNHLSVLRHSQSSCF